MTRSYAVGLVVVRGRVVRRADVEERVEEPRDIAAEQERGDPRLVGLEAEGDDVAHQPHVLADVFGQAVVGSLHRDGQAGPGPLARSSAFCLAARIGAARFSTSRTLVRYSSSLARSPALTWRLRSAASSRTRSRMLWLRLLPRLSKRLSKASDG